MKVMSADMEDFAAMSGIELVVIDGNTACVSSGDAVQQRAVLSSSAGAGADLEKSSSPDFGGRARNQKRSGRMFRPKHLKRRMILAR